MRREDVFVKMFELEFCEPAEKARREAELKEQLELVCKTSGKPFFAVKLAVLKCYPKYRAERLRRELPSVPPSVRGQ